MMYGPFSLVDATAGGMNFKLWANTEEGYDTVGAMASIDGVNFSGYYLSGNTGGWVDETLDLSDVYILGSLLGEPQVWVAILFNSDPLLHYPEGAYVDNILVARCMAVSCGGLATGQREPDGGQSITKPATATIHR
jgi:hypothetical protein